MNAAGQYFLGFRRRREKDIGGTPGEDCLWPCEIFGRVVAGTTLCASGDYHSCARNPYRARALDAYRRRRATAADLAASQGEF